MSDAFAGAIVKVNEIFFPTGSKAFIVNCKAMILRSDIGFLGAAFQHRLIVTAVAKFKLIGVGA